VECVGIQSSMSDPGSLASVLAREMDSLLVFQSEFFFGSKRCFSSCDVSLMTPLWGSFSSLVMVGVDFGRNIPR
jgi:hypothetical protein